MSVDEKKTIPQEEVDREVEAAVSSESTGLDPVKAAELREKIRKRVREEMERELKARPAFRADLEKFRPLLR